MNKKNSYTLRIKVLVGLISFISLIILSSFYQLKTLDLSEQNHQFVVELNKLEQLAAVYPRRSETYVNNAARDFETYNRDVQIFHKDIIGDINLFDDLLKEFSENSQNVGFALPRSLQALFGIDDHYHQVVESVEQANVSWNKFLAGFQEKIGDNKAEPRIEWGAQFIVTESPKVKAALNTMVQEYVMFTEEQQAQSLNVLKATIAFIMLYGLFALAWFYLRVIKRISHTVDACQQVANGDYGYVLPIEGNDELTVLSQAFNILSSRSQLVISMLGELQQVPTAVHALNVIVKASGSYLPVSWAGIMTLDNHTKQMMINHALPPKSLNNWNDRALNSETAFGQKVSDSLLSKKSILMNDLKGFVLDAPDELMLRNMVKATQINALFALPLTTESGWEGLALFGTRTGQYTEAQTELLENLAPLIANSLEKFSV